MLKDVVTQVEKRTLAQHIVQQLMDLIMSGQMKPGERLPPEQQLMEMFGVGRSSLREAARALNALGLIEVRVPEGTFVSKDFGEFFTKQLALMSKISFDNILELIEARLSVETDIAEMAARKATPEDHVRLEKVLEAMRQARDNEAFLQADLQFHTELAEMARNSFMLHLINILRDVTREWIQKVIQSGTSKPLVVRQHEKITSAIRNNDVEGAVRAMKEHLLSVSELLMESQKNGRDTGSNFETIEEESSV